MFFGFQTRVRPIIAALMLGCAGLAFGANENDPAAQKTKTERTDKFIQNTMRAHEQRLAVQSRAGHFLALLGSEIALQKGDAGTALGTYMMLLHQTKDPEVAERAMEMAVSIHAYEQAEQIFQMWQKIEPVPGKAQRRMAWARSLVKGDTDWTAEQLNDVLDNVTEEQVRRIFLLLAQMSIQQSDLAGKAVDAVHQAAQRYPELPEAAIADVVFSARSGREEAAVSALQKLSKLDNEMLPPTTATLRILAQRTPKILERFFTDADTDGLSPVWQEMEVAVLMQKGDLEVAYQRLQALLEQNPNPNLYIQMAFFAIEKKEPVAVINQYLEKALKNATQEQRSRAAFIGAMRNAEAGEFTKAKQWADRIVSPDFVFDKAVLSASIAAQQENWKLALSEARRALKLPEQQGQFFNSDDLQGIYLIVLANTTAKPEQAVAELTAIASKARKQGRIEHWASAMYQRGLLYVEKLNQPEKAVADFRAYLEVNPDAAEGLNALGYTMLSLKKYDIEEAFKLIESAYRINPESAAINDSLGWVYYLKGDAASALPYLQYAFQEYPDAEVAAHLGEVLWSLGEKQKAQAVFADSRIKGDKRIIMQTRKRLGIAVFPQKKAVKTK
ncbi:tetratricopeptide repeat protein [Neisseria weaveri]|uniref:tetratricopeptide repeat protein n=1 Tax=Neisseria weaveri TaxID=28091 RepID=UPI0002DF2C6C|nr:tetratricopeptide repeat protein [Neisseria weaveri]